MIFHRSALLFLLLCWSSISVLANQDVEDEPELRANREKRQLGLVFNSAVNDIRWRLNKLGFKIDNYYLPQVHYAAEKIRYEYAPSFAQSVKDITNRVVINAAERFQKGAQYLSEEVAPVIEDKVVEISNAAVPVVNKGIDVVGNGLQVGVNAVSKTTSDGIQQIGEKVLGEQRHTRIKKIANNISVNFNNSINNLAGKIKKVTEEETDEGLSYVDISGPTQTYTQFKHGYPPNFHQVPASPPQTINSHYQTLTPINKNTQFQTNQAETHMTMPQALRKLMSNTAYTISKQILGPNLTEAVAPIARSVSDVIENNFPTVPSGSNSVQQVSNEAPEPMRPCTTPEGQKGFCQNLQQCPNLVLKFSVLRRSICFKSLFDPGVCCPDVGQLKALRDKEAAAQAVLKAQSVRPNSLVSQPGGNFVQRPGFPGFPQQVVQTGFGGSPFLVHPGQQLLYQNPAQQVIGGNPVGQPTVVTTAPFVQNNKIHRDNIIINSQFRNNEYECGVTKVPQFRVVGGEESFIGEWPWTAAIYLHGKKKTEFWCGGSLISEEFVLTAAHCTKDSKEKTFNANQFTVHLGDYNIFNKDDDQVSKPEVYKVRYIQPHPAFKRHGYFNDIALIKLSRSVKFTPYILPVCLPPEAIERSHIDALVGQTPSVIGYGSTHYDGPQSNALRDVQLPIWKNSDCDKAYFQPITDIFICAGFVEGGRDACQGDSGGPMMLYYQGRWIQLGIVSFGNRCAEPGYPGVYTRITQFLPWIRQSMR